MEAYRGIALGWGVLAVCRIFLPFVVFLCCFSFVEHGNVHAIHT